MKTPASPADQDDCHSIQTTSSSNNTISNINPSTSNSLSQQQKIEQQKLMPAPLHIPQQQVSYNTNSVVSQNHHQQNLHDTLKNLQQQQSLQNSVAQNHQQNLQDSLKNLQQQQSLQNQQAQNHQHNLQQQSLQNQQQSLSQVQQQQSLNQLQDTLSKMVGVNLNK